MSDIVIGGETPIFVGHGFGPSAEDVYGFVREKMLTEGYLLDGTRESTVLAGSKMCDLQEDPVFEVRREPADEPLRGVYESLRPSREAREEARAIVFREAEARRHTDLVRFSDDSIRTAVNYIGWQLFDDFDAPLPMGVHAGPFGAPCVLNETASAAAALYKMTFAPGVHPRITELYGESVSTYEATAYTSEFILQHPLYRTLAALADTVQTKQVEQPLTQYEKDVAGASIAAHVRWKNGMQAGESDIEEPGVAREIYRQVSRLDDATVQKVLPDNSSEQPFQKAQSYLESLFTDSKYMTAQLRNFVHQEDSDTRELIVTHTLLRSGGALPPRVAMVWDFLMEFTQTMLHTIYQPMAGSAEASKEDYARLLSREHITEQVGQRFSSSYFGYLGRLSFPDGSPNYQTHAQIRLGDLTEIYYSYLQDTLPSFAMNVSHAEDNSSVICANETANSEPYAVVLESRLPVGAPRGMRMIAPSPVVFDKLPEPGEGTPYDLVIQRGGNMLAMPFTVAGFAPVAKDGDKIYFAYTPEHDPNTPAEVPLPTDTLQSLISQYENAGLLVLAKKLHAKMPRTVEDLRHQLATYARYASGDGGPKSVFAGTISELADAYAVDGRMHYQCTGASQLLKLSLQQLFGTESARPIEGQVFDPTSQHIGPVGHAQVLFTHEGRQYYVDATPAQADTRGIGLLALRPLISRFSSLLLRQFASQQPEQRQVVPVPPVVSSFAPEAEHVAVVPEKPVFTNEQADAEVSILRDRQLLPVLYSYFGVPHDEGGKGKLYKEVMQLPEGDPSRRVLEMTHRLPAGNMSAEEVRSLREYIHNIQSLSPSSPLFSLIDYQSPAQLKVLEGIVKQAEAVLAKLHS